MGFTWKRIEKMERYVLLQQRQCDGDCRRIYRCCSLWCRFVALQPLDATMEPASVQRSSLAADHKPASALSVLEGQQWQQQLACSVEQGVVELLELATAAVGDEACERLPAA